MHQKAMCDAFELCGKSAGTESPISKETKEELLKEEEEPLGKEETARFPGSGGDRQLLVAGPY